MTRREFPALGFDPAPGDAGTVTSVAGRIAGAARTFDTAATRVATLTATGWVGEAGDAFRARIGLLPRDLDWATSSHEAAARALADYGAGLASRQRRAADLEFQAAELRSRHAIALSEVNRLTALPAPDGSAERAELRSRYSAVRARAESVQAELDQILVRARDLRGEHHSAAATAARTVRAAADTPYAQPSALSRAVDAAKRWITRHADVLESISTVLRGVSAVLGVLSLVPGLQFLAPFAMLAGGLALAIDVAVKFATGRGSWKSLALDAALTVLPVGRVARAIKQIPHVTPALRAVNHAIPHAIKRPLLHSGLSLPDGISHAQRAEARALIRAQAGHYGDDVVVQGSCARYDVHARSDVDIGLRVDPDEFRRIAQVRYANVVPGTKEAEASVNCLAKGIIHWRRAGLKPLREDLVKLFGSEVDISVIERGGSFDLEPWVRL